MPTATTELAADRRFRQTLIRLAIAGPNVDDDAETAGFVEGAVAELAADHRTEPFAVYDLLAGALWGMEARTAPNRFRWRADDTGGRDPIRAAADALASTMTPPERAAFLTNLRNPTRSIP